MEKEYIYYKHKRYLDLLLLFFTFIVGFPLFLLIFLIIKITSRGSIFYKHKRIGQNGRFFYIYKFRTMVNGAEKLLPQILKNDPKAREEFENGYKLKNDPRVTRIGKFLRKTSLDELPQLINILKGEMSFVGPRPIVEEEKIKYGKYLPQLLKEKPGLTGLWQVSGRNNLSYEERVALDMEYIRKKNLRLDIKIILKTIIVLFSGNGAY
ncbi:MAG: sugar transferase [candidate division WOR-3 bacterium]|nr:sugar transferase [candidate division WOR-3 bacterium]MDW8114551.1 sugar transferase [candidate division WOR-3 bacterium]